MSTRSKRRKKAREWMQQERQRHAATVQRMEVNHRATIQNIRDEYERLLPPDDHDTFYPQGRPAQTVLRIMDVNTGPTMNFDDYMRDQYMYNARARVYTLVAKQKAFRLPGGKTICWFDWEVK